MRKTFILLVSLIFVAIFSPSTTFASLNWTETQPGGNATYSWSLSAISQNGQKIIVGHQDGGLYLSSNAGGSWTQILTEFPSDVWYTASMSADGQVIMAGTYGQRVHISTDGGVNWSETRPAGDTGANWITSSMSDNAEVIMIGSESGRLYRSTNQGSSWSEIRPAGDVDASWYMDVSSDGQTILAAMDDGTGGRLYISTNAGNSWTETRPDGNQDWGWRTVSISGDGQVMLAAVYSGKVFLSTNGGSNWSEAFPVGNQSDEWRHSEITEDGGTLLISSTQRLHTSTNRGGSWVELQPIGNQNGNWDLLNISGNGQVLLAGNYSGRLYIGTYPPLTGAGKSTNGFICTDVAQSGAPDLFSISSSKTSVTLNFTTQKGNGYSINYGLTPEANQFGELFNYHGPEWTLSRAIANLSPNTTYYFKVRATYGCNAGEWSQTVQVKTKR